MQRFLKATVEFEDHEVEVPLEPNSPKSVNLFLRIQEPPHFSGNKVPLVLKVTPTNSPPKLKLTFEISIIKKDNDGLYYARMNNDKIALKDFKIPCKVKIEALTLLDVEIRINSNNDETTTNSSEDSQPRR